VIDYTGESTTGIGAGAMFTANDIRGLYFDVLSPVIFTICRSLFRFSRE
jgi:hypothetical protein